MFPDPSTARAVLIGTHSYRYLEDLPAVANNLVGLKETFVDPDGWALPSAHCVTLAQVDDARLLLDAIHEAAADAASLLLIYYGGHGMISPHDDDLYLSLPSSRKDRLHWALRYDDVRRAILTLSRSTAKIVILDCCFSARAMADGMAAPIDLADRSRIEGTYILAAAGETKLALAPAGADYTAFTGELLSTLRYGIEGAPQFLDLDTIFQHVRASLIQKGFPRPEQRSRNDGARIVLGRNLKYRPELPGALARPDHPRSSAGNLSALLHAQLRAASSFPYPLAGARSAGLSEVYVRQQLGVGLGPTDSAEGYGAQNADGVDVPTELGPAQPSPADLRRPFTEALQQHRNLIIVGGPGQGKSVLTLQTAAQLAASNVHGTAASPEVGGQRLLPLRVAAPDLAGRTGPLASALIDSAAAELGSALDHPLPTDLMEQAPSDCCWLLIVDGLDEIPDPGKFADFLSVLSARLREDTPRTRWLITTRRLPSADMQMLIDTGAGCYTLEAFDRDQLTAFADRWFAADGSATRAGEFLQEIRSMGLGDLIGVPLLATIAAILYEQGEDHGLPSNQYLLYEHYFTYLKRAHNSEVLYCWNQIVQLIAESTSRTALPTDIGRLCDDLVESMAIAAVNGDEDLEGRALRLLDEHGYRQVSSRTPEWRELVARLLSTIGLFVRVGQTLRFAHLSFAEHLAARSRARQLKLQFDPDEPEMAAFLRAAAAGQREAIAVLVHWAYICSDLDKLLTWLEHGSERWLLLAGVLLAEGPVTAPVHAERFFEHFQHRLVLTARHYWPVSYLDDEWKVARRLGSGGIGMRFLITAASDEHYQPWQRIAAASALAPHAEEGAVSALRALMSTRTSWHRSQLEAAVALAGLGEQFVGEAAGCLMALVTATDVDGNVRRDAVTALREFGNPYEAQARDGLRVIVSTASIDTSYRLMAAQDLADGDENASTEVVPVLRQILADGATRDEDRQTAAVDLVSLDPRYTDAAAQALRAILGVAEATENTRLNAARTMAWLGDDYAAEAAGALRSLTTAENRPSWDRSRRVQLWAAAALASLGGAYVDEAAGVLTELIAAAETYEYERSECAEKLAQLAPAHVDRAAGVLRAVINDPRSDAARRLDAARVLASLGRIGEAAQAMGVICSAEDAAGAIRVKAALAITQLDPEDTGTAVRALRAVARDKCADANLRVDAAAALCQQGASYEPEAADEFRSVLASPTADARARTAAAAHLVNLGPWFTDEVVRVLRSVMATDSEADERIWAASVLGMRLGPHFADEAATVLHQAIVAAKTTRSGRQRAVELLAELGPSHRGRAAFALLEFLTSKGVHASERIESVNLLERKFGPDYGDDAARVLGGVISAPDTDCLDRKEATIALYALKPARKHIDGTVRELLALAQRSAGPQSELLNLAKVLGEAPSRDDQQAPAT
jgi:Caspase domain/NACHT domain